jgi:prepilin-type N-terminal cleavage/methylation domain-containing protein
VRREGGFSLVEVLIAIVIVGFALIAIIEMFSVVGRGSESAENMAIAANLAQERIEDIRHLVQNGITIDVGTGTYSFDSTTLPNVVENTVSYLNGGLYLTELDLPPEKKLGLPGIVDRVTQIEWAEGVDTYKKVQVTVFWKEKGTSVSCGLITLIRD